VIEGKNRVQGFDSSMLNPGKNYEEEFNEEI